MDITDEMVDGVYNRAILIPPGTQAGQIKEMIRQPLEMAALAREHGWTRERTKAELARGMRSLGISRLPIPAMQLDTERECAEFYRMLAHSVESIYGSPERPWDDTRTAPRSGNGEPLMRLSTPGSDPVTKRKG
jgi:hypothetical protein